MSKILLYARVQAVLVTVHNKGLLACLLACLDPIILCYKNTVFHLLRINLIDKAKLQIIFLINKIFCN